MEKNKAKSVHNLIVVDQSGSMTVIRKEAFEGLNETLKTIRQIAEKHPEQEQFVSLLTFDTTRTNWLYDNVPASRTRSLDWEAYTPSGCTPLYDAIGAGISRVNSQIPMGEPVLVTIITDGEENSSREWTLQMVRTMIDKLKEQGWTFTLIGTDNLDVESMARSFSINEHMVFRQDTEGTLRMFSLNGNCISRFYGRLRGEESDIPEGSFFSPGSPDDEESESKSRSVPSGTL